MGKKDQLIQTIPEEIIFRKIYEIREQKVMLDVDLAEMYGVETKVLNQAVKRNIQRFPADFMFVLTSKEKNSINTYIIDNENDTDLRSQIVTLETGRGRHSKYLPYAFTEQGIAMLSSVLNSHQAIEVNIHIMRLFVKMRQMAVSYKDLLKRIEGLEESEMEQNESIREIYNYMKEMLEPALKDRKPIGYKKKQ